MPRVVCSLRLVTPPPVDGGTPVKFIVPLDHQGNGAGRIQPVGKSRVVDLRPGDYFDHVPTQERYKLTPMSAYRQAQLTDEMLASGYRPSEGYLVPK